MSQVIRAWNRFFFEPILPTTLGLFRICYGLIVFIAVLGAFPFRETFYGINAIVQPDVAAILAERPLGILTFSFLPVTDPGMAFFLLALMVASLMLSMGLFSRTASFLVLVGVFSIHNRNLFILNAGDLLMRINALLLVFADSGAAFSIDRWRETRRHIPMRRISPWPVRLMQMQLSYLYLTTALYKLDGPSWRDGTALYYALRYLELQRFSLKPFFYYLWQIKLATWTVLIAEFSMGTLVWIRQLRYPILLIALALHTGINLTMQFPVFQYVMMINLILFIYPEDLSLRIAWRPAGTVKF